MHIGLHAAHSCRPVRYATLSRSARVVIPFYTDTDFYLYHVTLATIQGPLDAARIEALAIDITGAVREATHSGRATAMGPKKTACLRRGLTRPSPNPGRTTGSRAIAVSL